MTWATASIAAALVPLSRADTLVPSAKTTFRKANPGDRLPPARPPATAAVIGVNTNTVLRALRALRDEGLLEMRPRRGIRVVGTPAESELRGKVAELVQLARQRGYTRTDLLKMITNAA